jgi:F0F1-type ATP synthase beta subunit
MLRVFAGLNSLTIAVNHPTARQLATFRQSLIKHGAGGLVELFEKETSMYKIQPLPQLHGIKVLDLLVPTAQGKDQRLGGAGIADRTF